MTDAPATVADAMRQTALALAEMHMPDPRREARLLLAVALDAEPLQLVTEPQRPMSASDRAALSAALARRLLVDRHVTQRRLQDNACKTVNARQCMQGSERKTMNSRQ